MKSHSIEGESLWDYMASKVRAAGHA